MPRYKPVIGVIQVCLVVALIAALIWAARTLNWHILIRALAAAAPAKLIGMALAWLLVVMVRPLRLRMLLRAIAPKHAASFGQVWSAYTVAMAANSIAPMRAGDVIMAFILQRSTGIAVSRALSAVLLDRAFDLASIMVIFLGAFDFAPPVAPWMREVVVLVLIVFVAADLVLLLMVAFHSRILEMLERGLLRLGSKQHARWRSILHGLFSGLEAIRAPRILGLAIIVSIIIWGLTAFSYWLGIAAVWPDVPVVAAPFAVGAVALSFVIPLAPGGFGVFHAVTVIALSLFGVPAEQALAFAIIAHAFQLISVLLLAAAALVIQRIDIRALVAIRRTES